MKNKLFMTEKQKQELLFPRNEELLSAITPTGIEFKRNHFMLGENLCRIYSIIKYPPEANFKWLMRLTNIPDVVVGISSVPIDEGKFIENMSRAASDNRSVAESTKDALERSRKLKTAEDAEKIMTEIDQNAVGVAGYAISILVMSRDEKDLKKKCARVESAVNTEGCRVRIVSHLQQEAYKHISPTYEPQKVIRDIAERPMFTLSFTGGFPFAKNEFYDDGGYYIGKNGAGNIVLYDPWRRTRSRTNSNITIIGNSGMGKSTGAKHLALSEIARGTKVIIIDPDGEYKDICCSPYVNGKWIDVAGGRGGLINPLQVRPAPRDDEEAEQSNVGDLAIHLKTLQTFFSLYIPSLTDKDRAVLEKTLIELYESFNITFDKANCANMANDEYPTLSDLYALIRKHKSNKDEEHREIYADLELLLTSAAVGADKGLWNGYTSIDGNSKCICLDTKAVTNMGGGVLAAQYFNILSWCWQEMSKNQEERVMLIADECWALIDPRCPQALDFLRNAERRARKYEASVMVSTQQIEDFLDPSIKLYGQAILDMPSVKFIFGMDGRGFQEVKDVFSLNDSQCRVIEAQTRGIALVKAGNETFRLKFDLSPERLKMMGTGGGR